MPAIAAAVSSASSWLPVAALAWLAVVFGRSLRRGEMALIERICRRSIAAPSARLCRYTRRLTAIWTAYFVCGAIVAALLATASGGFAVGRFGAAVWGGSIALFVGEWVLRRAMFPHVAFPNLLQQVRDTWNVWAASRAARGWQGRGWRCRRERAPVKALEAARPADLARMKAIALGLLAVAALLYIAASALQRAPSGLGLCGRLRRGGDGRRDRRLVRGRGAVPPSARPADPAHGDHPEQQGPHRREPRDLHLRELPQHRSRCSPSCAQFDPARAPRRLARRAAPRRAGSARTSAPPLRYASACSTTSGCATSSARPWSRGSSRSTCRALAGQLLDVLTADRRHQRAARRRAAAARAAARRRRRSRRAGRRGRRRRGEVPALRRPRQRRRPLRDARRSSPASVRARRRDGRRPDASAARCASTSSSPSSSSG